MIHSDIHTLRKLLSLKLIADSALTRVPLPLTPGLQQQALGIRNKHVTNKQQHNRAWTVVRKRAWPLDVSQM